MSELFSFMVEHLLPEEEAKELTSPFWEDFSRVWAASWQMWGEMTEEQRARLMETPMMPPIVMFGLAQSFANEIFSNRDEEGIIKCQEISVCAFYIHEKILVRFNNLGTDYIVHNTQNSGRKEMYFGQEPIYGINNSATRLTVGSVANAAKTDLDSVVISCQVGDSLHYSFRIDDAHGSVLAGPSAINPPQPDAVSERVINRKPR